MCVHNLITSSKYGWYITGWHQQIWIIWIEKTIKNETAKYFYTNVVSNDGVETLISKMNVKKGQSKQGNLRIVTPNIEPKGGDNYRSIRMNNKRLKQLLD